MGEEKLEFSITVPTYNRPQRLTALLEQLARSDYPRERFEVIVVDDGSVPPLQPVVERFRDVLNVVYLRQNHGGVAKGRQAGAEAGHGRFLAFTDDDCLPAPDWLPRMEATLKSLPNCACGGRTLNALPQNHYSSASQALTRYIYERMNAMPGGKRFFANNNFALPRELYLKIGGLDTTWPMCGEDRDLCARWLDHGYPLLYAPEAIVYHAHELSFARFWRQHFNYGRGAYRFHKTYAARHNTGVRLEPISFYLRLPLAAFAETGGVRGLWIATLLMVSQVANAAGFVAERIRPKQLPSS